MFSHKDQAELNHHGINGLWFPKYAEFFSVFRVEGSGGLKDKLRAYYATEDHGREELDQLASQSLSEKEWLAYLRMNPDAEVPNYDKAYLDLVQKLASQAFLALQERGSLEDIKLIDGELPAIAEQQYDALVNEARSVQQRAASAAERKAAADAEMKIFADHYTKERADNLRPRGGFVTLAGETIPWGEFQAKFNAAVAAGYIR
jgi:hypothetical protein